MAASCAVGILPDRSHPPVSWCYSTLSAATLVWGHRIKRVPVLSRRCHGLRATVLSRPRLNRHGVPQDRGFVGRTEMWKP